MVPLSEVGKAVSSNPPITISPQVEGVWRWRDPRTLTFQPDQGRFSYSTKYQIALEGKIKEGNSALTYSHAWDFSTETLGWLGWSSSRWDQKAQRHVVEIVFNQPVDLAEIAPFIVLTDGNKEYETELRLIADGPGLRNNKRWYPEAQAVEVVAKHRLPASTKMTWLIKEGIPAKEGTLPAEDMDDYTFSTQSALAVVGVERRRGSEACLEFNNHLIKNQDFSSLIQLSPPVEKLRFDLSYDRLCLGGLDKGSSYSLRVLPKIKDVYGQNLELSIDEYDFSLEVIKEESWLNILRTDKKRDQYLSDIGRPFYLDWMYAGPIILGPGEPREIPFDSLNADSVLVELRTVDPSEFVQYQNLKVLFDGMGQDHATRFTERKFGHGVPGALVKKYELETQTAINATYRGSIDLTPALDMQGLGHVLVMLSIPEHADEPRDGRYKTNRMIWVQSTNLAVKAFPEYGKVTAWVSSLDKGLPLEGVSVQLDGKQSVTDENGVALVEGADLAGPLVATKDGDSVFLLQRFNSSQHEWDSGGNRLIWHVFDDRKIYKPGEVLTVKGTLRQTVPGEGLKQPSKNTSIKWQAKDAKDNEFASGDITLDDQGSFDFRVDLPKQIAQGRGAIGLQLVQPETDESISYHAHWFNILEYRRPEFEVEVKFPESQSAEEVSLAVEAKANYYSGGPLAEAAVDWTFYAIGAALDYDEAEQFSFSGRYRGDFRTKLGETEGMTDKAGVSRTPVFSSWGKAIKLSEYSEVRKVRAVASVEDKNNQRWSGSAEYLVDGPALRVGLRPHKKAVQVGDEIVIDVVVLNQDGSTDTKAELTAEYYDYELSERVSLTPQCQWLAEERLQQCTVNNAKRGPYRFTAKVRDNDGKRYEIESDVEVMGEKLGLQHYKPKEDYYYSNRIELVPDQLEYKLGDTANIYIGAPFQHGEALVTFNQEGVFDAQRILIRNGYYQLRVPITDAHIPNFGVHVTALVDIAQAKKLKRGFTTLKATGNQNIPVSAESRRLAVNIEPGKPRYAPGEEVNAAISVTDAQGKPVDSAGVTFYAVDESVLASSSYQTPDPHKAFYQYRQSWIRSSDTRDILTFLYSDLGRNPGSGGFMASAGSRNDPMAGSVRKDFSALATFQANLKTDSQGQVGANFTLPESLTRYRLIAVVQAEASYFGAGESTVEAYLPLMARPSLPRFINVGDQASVPVVLQNSTDTAMVVDVEVEGENLTIKQRNKQRITVPAHNRTQVEFPVKAKSEGKASLRVVATSNKYRDEVAVEVPVYSPMRQLAISHYGAIEGETAHFKLLSPEAIQAGSGVLELSASTSQLQSLQDAYVYLVNYPHSCSEQLSSRLVSVLAMQQAADIFQNAELPDAQELNETLTDQIGQLVGRQNVDGGWPLWRKGESSLAFLSVHVLQALILAQQAGYEVPAGAIERGFSYLDGTFVEDLEGEAWPVVMQALAYGVNLQAAYNRSMSGLNTAFLQNVKAESDWNALPVSTMGWLIHAYSGAEEHDALKEKLYDLLDARLIETDAEAKFAEEYGSWRHSSMASSARANAIVLLALLKDSPDSALIDKIVRGLVANKAQGAWKNTQANVFALLALKQYYQQFETGEVNTTLTISANGDEVAQSQFDNKKEQFASEGISLSDWGINRKKANVSLASPGEGRIFYRLAATYIPEKSKQAAADNGFSVARHYEAVDNPQDVQRMQDGSWRIRAGAKVRITLVMDTNESRHDVALVDSLPAGLEPINHSLANVEDVPRALELQTYQPNWYDHSELRDTGAQAYVQRLSTGGYLYTYQARAVTPGQYTAPAVKAEEMYNPEIFGQSESTMVLVY
ncbi:DUF6049 family protein [Gilvimarinus sp. SDUM040013]|uniref:DUF6049 family protein n=1 Tax=Gilvimarinus gilvus TaxID=3058038 RepID=A0ABU4RUV8_9GAMM|nr:DUF6049 family protein [Gilvimarinus sp. SDUM040013]MDO3388441.1 DUF6049 family protein [Gilvimarinus sp. SDUM040013]MDX6847991.1 DUF6049 family protein [Gilvimarinus sp. SDUM040013]